MKHNIYTGLELLFAFAHKKQISILPREVIFIIDVSGSMGGEAICQAKAALLKALDGLSPTDRFNIIAFNDSAHKFFPTAVKASPRKLSNARNYISRLYVDGGTEMAQALSLALDGAIRLEYLRQIIFMTDGSVGNEDYLYAIWFTPNGWVASHKLV